MRIAIVGGGITGLAAAYEALRSATAEDVVVLEASDRLGGKIHTTTFAGRAVDEGADAFLVRVPWALDLCRELGLDDRLTSPATGEAHVWWEGALRRLPPGLVLGVPTDLAAAESSGIVPSPIPHRPGAAPLAPDEDVAVGALIRSQLGDEVAERLVDPLLGGINAGDADHLSVRAATPQLAAAAEADADLVAALRRLPSAGPGPVFAAPRDGMGALVDALAAAIRRAGGRIQLGAGVTRLEDVDADGVVLAVPATAAAALVRDAAPTAAAWLDEIDYASVTLVTMAFATGSVGRSMDGSGYLVPRSAGLLHTACSWATTKWAQLAEPADGISIVRVSAGRWGDDRHCGIGDSELVTRLLDELRLTMDMRGEPTEVRVSRWPQGFPQYRPGHLERVAAIEADLAERLPRVAIAGAGYRGLGVPACIRQGRESATR